MIELQNLQTYSSPDMLFPQEINALLGIIKAFTEEYGRWVPYSGTCILSGQKYGQKAKSIFRFNLPAGAYHRNFFRTYERSSDEIATESIDEIVNQSFNEPSRYQRFFTETGTNNVPTSVYRDGELQVLVLNARHGRFLFTFHSRSEACEQNFDLDDCILYVVAEALAIMGKEDPALQRNSINLIHAVPQAAAESILSSINLTRRYFVGYKSIPEIAIWRDWHEPANDKGELKLFFE